MDVGTFQPVKNISPESNGGVVQGFQNPFAFQGELGIFDLLFQQLLLSSDQIAEFGPGGQPLPFGIAVSNTAIFPTFTEGSEGQFFLDAEQLADFLGQFDLDSFPELSIPAIFQELQIAFEQATSLGQTQVDLAPILSTATNEQGLELLSFLEENSSGGLNPAQQVLKNFLGYQFESQGQAAQGQNSSQTNFGQSIKQVVQEQFHGELPETAKKPLEEQFLKFILGNSEGPVEFGARHPRPVVAEGLLQTQQSVPLQNDIFGNLNLPDYLNPETYGKQELVTQVQQLAQQLGAKDGLQHALKQGSVDNAGQKQQALLEALGLSDQVSGEVAVGSGLNSSLNLNLTDQSSYQTENDSAAVDGETLKTDELSAKFPDNLKRLQEAQAVIDQISKNFHLRQAGQSSEMTFGLKPEHLGTLNLRVEVSQGAVSVQILAENSQVRDLLDSNLNALRNSFENSNLKVDKIDVSLFQGEEDFLGDTQLDAGAAGKETSDTHNYSDLDFEFSLEGAEAGEALFSTAEQPSLRDRIHRINAVA